MIVCEKAPRDKRTSEAGAHAEEQDMEDVKVKLGVRRGQQVSRTLKCISRGLSTK